VLVFARVAPSTREVFVAINMSGETRTVEVPPAAVGNARLKSLVASDPQARARANTFFLPPFATIVAAADNGTLHN